MTVENLKKLLQQFDDEKNVIVFSMEHNIVFETIAVRDNNGHAQIDVI